ncbi:delta-12-fatty acid desaturase [Meredithblackwellia eburnea MCA 4105]
MASTLRQRLPIEVKSSIPQDDDSQSSSSSNIYDDYEQSLKPFTPPTFTIKDLLGAIPAHCYERSALKSFSYVFGDFTMLAIFYYLATFIDPSFGKNGNILAGTQGILAKWSLWTLYWAFAGWVGTGVWILGHECGHQAFSTSKTLNNTMGLILHSFVLVPYHAWRISHSKHHAATGHMTRDEVFVPAVRSEKTKPTGKKVVIDGLSWDELLEDSPIYSLFWLVVQQVFGWPAYLVYNVSGQTWYPPFTNHFLPSSKLFDDRHRNQILLSDLGLTVMISGIYMFAKTYGFGAMMKYYGIPYLLVNHWLVMLTFLQHTDPNMPHYRASEWTFPRGALCTIDRNLLGFVGPYLTHGICETHIAHHIHSKIPHYHAWEATAALKEFLGEYYSYTDENMFVSLWKVFRTCRFVEDDDQVVFYKDAYGRAQRRVVYPQVASDSGVDVDASS